MTRPLFFSTPALELFKDSGKKNDSGDKPLSGVAYSGGPVTQWGERFVIDLDTLEAETPRGLLYQHRHDSPVGVIDAIGNDGKSLTINKGRLFTTIETDPLPRQIAERAARDFPYELSIGVYDGTEEIVPAGKTVTVNGRELQGPLTVVKNAVLREVSIVALGADPNTEANVAASTSHQRKPEEKTMPQQQNDQDGDAVAKLTARIAELQQELEAERAKREEAEKAVAEIKLETRKSAVRQLLTDIGIEYSDEAAKPYLSLSDEAFGAIADQVRKASQKTQEGKVLAKPFGAAGDVDPARDGAGDGKTFSLDPNEIYAKRRVD